MAAQRQYATAGAFRTALEARLNERARRDEVDLHRLRRQVAFDRLLARMFDRARARECSSRCNVPPTWNAFGVRRCAGAAGRLDEAVYGSCRRVWAGANAGRGT